MVDGACSCPLSLCFFSSTPFASLSLLSHTVLANQQDTRPLPSLRDPNSSSYPFYFGEATQKKRRDSTTPPQMTDHPRAPIVFGLAEQPKGPNVLDEAREEHRKR